MRGLTPKQLADYSTEEDAIHAKGLAGNPAETGEIFCSKKPENPDDPDSRHTYFKCSNTQKKKIEHYAGDKFLRHESHESLHAMQGKSLTIDKMGEKIEVVFDSKTTSHLANDVAESCNFLWNASMPRIRELLENATLVAHEPNAKTDKKPSAQHYYYYRCKVGNEAFYLNIEENYVTRENRHFYRLYAIVNKLRDSAMPY